MKMPETIYIGVACADADFLPPSEAGELSPGKLWLMYPRLSTDQVEHEGYVTEYRLVRQLVVTKTTPAPIIEVKEVQ